MAKEIRERDIEHYLVKRVNAMGGEVRKVKWIGRAGAPDRVLSTPRFGTAWVELKAPGKKPTAAQHREHERMRRVGMTVLVMDSFEDVDWFLS